ncbi:MAG: hypothetical protein ACR2PG_17490 [Hyphomicrobiaceae bacterium]
MNGRILRSVAACALIAVASGAATNASADAQRLPDKRVTEVIAKFEVAQRIRVRPKYRPPRRWIRNKPSRKEKRDDRKGGSSARIDNCERKAGGKVECTSQFQRFMNMVKGWF